MSGSRPWLIRIEDQPRRRGTSHCRQIGFHWDKQLKNPKAWHFNFRGPDVERLVAGRERILLDRFYNELSAMPRAQSGRGACQPRRMAGGN
jgi:hypothetical protein